MKYIAFDLGNVIFDFDEGLFYDFLLQHPEYSNCIYLDDREENVIAASKCGFNSIQFNLDDYKNDEQALNNKLTDIELKLLRI